MLIVRLLGVLMFLWLTNADLEDTDAICTIVSDFFDCVSNNITEICDSPRVDCENDKITNLDFSNFDLVGEFTFDSATMWPITLETIDFSRNNITGVFDLSKFNESSKIQSIIMKHNLLNTIYVDQNTNILKNLTTLHFGTC